MAIQVQHIADVSFKDHFLGAEEGQPVDGKITVKPTVSLWRCGAGPQAER